MKAVRKFLTDSETRLYSFICDQIGSKYVLFSVLLPRYFRASSRIPRKTRIPAAAVFSVTFSPRKSAARIITINTLDRSMGATLEASVSVRAAK